jgi:ornithine cyclodeaminase
VSNTLPLIHLSPNDVVRLVHRIGLSQCIAGVAERIKQDFLRWSEFDKSARVACHSPEGVVELMPIADATQFAFKYVNGHPKNTSRGLPTVMAFGERGEASVRGFARHRHASDVTNRRECEHG